MGYHPVVTSKTRLSPRELALFTLASLRAILNRAMNGGLHYVPVFFAGLFLSTGLLFGQTTLPQPLSADKILEKMADQAQRRAKRPDYSYNKTEISENLDGKGFVKNRDEEVYRVLVRNNVAHFKLVRLNGRNLTPAEIKKQEKQDLADRKKNGGSGAGEDDSEPENLLTPKILDKFSFRLLDEKSYNGRATYHLAFTPKNGAFGHSMIDHFLSHIAGYIWVDARDFELARAEIHLTAEVKIWDGVLGVLKQCHFTLQQTHLPNGAWFVSSSEGVFKGRKFLKPIFVKMSSKATDFQPAP